MSTHKSTFFCKECGAHYVKWQGQCNKCNNWNTIVEEFNEISKKKFLGS